MGASSNSAGKGAYNARGEGRGRMGGEGGGGRDGHPQYFLQVYAPAYYISHQVLSSRS